VSLIVIHREDDVVSAFNALPEHGVGTYGPFGIYAFRPRPRDAGRDGFAVFISHRVRVESRDDNPRAGDPPVPHSAVYLPQGTRHEIGSDDFANAPERNMVGQMRDAERPGQ